MRNDHFKSLLTSRLLPLYLRFCSLSCLKSFNKAAINRVATYTQDRAMSETEEITVLEALSRRRYVLWQEWKDLSSVKARLQRRTAIGDYLDAVDLEAAKYDELKAAQLEYTVELINVQKEV